MRISDWSSDVCSSDLQAARVHPAPGLALGPRPLPQLSGSDPDPLLRVGEMALSFRRKRQPDMIGDTRPSWHLHRYLQGSANLFEENRLLKVAIAGLFGITAVLGRSEEHTSELQSLMRISYAVFCLKKKKRTKAHQVYLRQL